MCLPVLAIAGLAAMAAGTGMQALGQSQADHAMTRTFNTERTRQQGYEAKEQQDFKNSLASTQNTVLSPEAQAAAVANRQGEYDAVTKSATPAGSYLPGSPSAPSVVNAGNTVIGQAADAHTAGLGHALASLGGTNDLMQQNDINIGRDRQDVAQQADFGRGSMNVLPAELDAAKRKGSTLRTLGGLAQSIGSMMVSGGATGGFSPAAVSPGMLNPTALASVAPTNWAGLLAGLGG